MKKALLPIACVLGALLCFSVPAVSQGRFDIAFEGPWIFYQENNFKLSTGSTTYSVLVAIAPNVPGHFPMVFTSGAGARIDTMGIYCVGLDKACTLNGNTSLGYDHYPVPKPIRATKGIWHWEKQRGYILILPLPDSWSDDGEDQFTFQDQFPSMAVTPHSTNSEHHAIGMQLHYGTIATTSPAQQFSLIGCTVQGGASSSIVGTCNGTPTSTDNSGTLHITIRNNENPLAPSLCDYHVRRAYHYMTKIIGNADHRYMNVPTYNDSCIPCDPQQDFISSDCATMEAMVETPTTADINDALNLLIDRLAQDKDPKFPPTAFEEAEKQFGQFITTAQTLSLQAQVFDFIKKVDVPDFQTMGVRANSQAVRQREQSLGLAKRRAQALGRLLETAMNSATNGKDCRAPEILVGP